MAQQTAVEWLVNHWKKLQSEGEKMSWQQIIDITELAKEMEKQQIINAHLTGLIHPLEIEATKQAEQYYNETYKKD